MIASGENCILLMLERVGQVWVTCAELVFQDFNLDALVLVADRSAALMILYELWWLRHFRSQRTMAEFTSGLLGVLVAGASLTVRCSFCWGSMADALGRSSAGNRPHRHPPVSSKRDQKGIKHMSEKMPVRIVPMTADHLDAVAALERICFSDPWSRNLLAAELDNDLSAFLVALDGEGEVAGYAGLQVVLDEGTVTNIAVRPDCRRRGVASRLLQVFLDFAQGNRLAFLTLEVRASNYDAIALYGSRGFRSAGRRQNYYEHPREDAIIMTRDFSAASAEAGEEVRS